MVRWSNLAATGWSRWGRGAAILILLFLVVCSRLSRRSEPEVGEEDRFQVVKVVDGDTFVLAGGDRLRLRSIDAPEKGYPLYEEATRFLSDMVLGKVVRLEFSGERRDKYGRLLGHVFVDSVFVGEEILRSGLGYLFLFSRTDPGSPRTESLLAAQREAMKARCGLWAIAREPEDYYVARVNSFRLHRPACRSVKRLSDAQSRIFETREEALSLGLSPCRNCQP